VRETAESLGVPFDLRAAASNGHAHERDAPRRDIVVVGHPNAGRQPKR
jgi:hypothetical protein